MYEIPPTAPSLPYLFSLHIPNSPQLWAVLLGHAGGSALVDRLHDPSMCVIRSEAALTYFGPGTSQTFLDGAITRFRRKGRVWLVLPSWGENANFETGDAEIIRRKEFYEPNSAILVNLREQLPTEFEIRKVDQDLLEQCAWKEEMIFYTGSVGSFLKNGLGYCLMRCDQIITEVYASALGKPFAEIGAITREEFRGNGYAPIACAYLIQSLEQRGYQAYWSCDADNTASVNVAQKLGFQQERPYKILEYGPAL